MPLVQTSSPGHSVSVVQGVGFLHSPSVHVKFPSQSVEVVQEVGFSQILFVQV